MLLPISFGLAHLFDAVEPKIYGLGWTSNGPIARERRRRNFYSYPRCIKIWLAFGFPEGANFLLSLSISISISSQPHGFATAARSIGRATNNASEKRVSDGKIVLRIGKDNNNMRQSCCCHCCYRCCARGFSVLSSSGWLPSCRPTYTNFVVQRKNMNNNRNNNN